MSEEKSCDLKTAYRPLYDPNQFDQFLNGGGALTHRREVADQFNYDWHARKLKFETHFRGHVLMQATAYESTHDHQWAAENDILFEAVNAGVNISVSGLAQANKNRPIEPYVFLMEQVMDTVARLPHRKLRALKKETWHGIVDLLRRTEIFDATTLSLPPQLADWSPALGQGDETAGLKLQLKVAGDSGAFKQMMLTPAVGNDCPYFDDLLGDLDRQEETIFVFDGGYWSLDTFARIIDSDNHFVTKRGGNISVHPFAENPLPEHPLSSEYTVLKDELVYLGHDRDHSYRRLRVQLTNGEEVSLLTSMNEKSADQICALYRYRWTIEVIFRWLKQRLQLDHFMSHDPTGILRQILTALIVWGLLIIYNQDGSKLSPKQLWRRLYADLHQAIYAFGYKQGAADATE